MIAGTKDALALTGIAAGALSALPWVAATPGLVYPAMLGSAAGAGWLLGKTLGKSLNPVKATNREGFVLKSDPVWPDLPMAEGLRLGYTTDFSQPLVLPNDVLSRHMEIVGMTGVGKTVLGEFLLWQQMLRGGGWIFIDAKLDTDTRDKLHALAKKCGRADDFLVLNTDDPANSNTYNPIQDGDGDEVASRLLTLIPSTDNNPGADHYKQTAAQAISTVVNGFKKANRLYTFGDLALLLQSPKAIDAMLRMVPEDSAEKRALAVFFDQFRMVGKDTVGTFDMKKIKDTFGGISGRIGQFANGNFGQVFNSYYPDINLYDVVRGNKMLYVMLPTMSKNIAALNLGKMLVSDLRTACARLQNLPKQERPNPPFLAFLDEFGSYVEASIAALFEQARSAGISLAVGMQSFANLKTVSEDFAEKVNQNTLTKVFFKFASQDAENASEIIGTAIKHAESISVGGSEGASTPALQASPDSTESDSSSLTVGYRETEVQRVTQDQLKSLKRGECIVYSNSRVFHIKTSMLTLEDRTLVPFTPTPRNGEALALDHYKRTGRTMIPAMLERDYRNYLTEVAPGGGPGGYDRGAKGDKEPPKPRTGRSRDSFDEDAELQATERELRERPRSLDLPPQPLPSAQPTPAAGLPPATRPAVDGLDQSAAKSKAAPSATPPEVGATDDPPFDVDPLPPGAIAADAYEEPA